MITYLAGNNNPIYGTYSNRYKDNVNRLIGDVSMTFSPFSFLDIDYKLGMDYYADFRKHAAPGPLGLADEIDHEDNELGFVNEYRISNRVLNSILRALSARLAVPNRGETSTPLYFARLVWFNRF